MDVGTSPSGPLAVRRTALEACGMDPSVLTEGTLGLAFSGGGIRSATISLGIAQALARHDRLLAFDYMSTVSGGGYFGSFLRSLYIGDAARGPLGVPARADVARFDFANRVLRSEPHERDLAGPAADGRRVVNPIWWLREHSRYLAPNGPTDFIFAASHVARNWLAMLYVFVVAIAALFTVKTGLVALGVVALRAGGGIEAAGYWHHLQVGGVTLSPIAPLVAVAAFLSLSVGVAFWMTEAMFLNPSWLFGRSDPATAAPSPRIYFLRNWVGTLAGLLALHLIVLESPRLTAAIGHGAAIAALGLKLFRWGEIFTLAMLAWAMAAFVTVIVRGDPARAPDAPAYNPTSELRRLLTQWLSRVNQAAAWLLVLAVIDTAAIRLHDLGAVPVNRAGLASLRVTVLLPLAAYLVRKLPEWLARFTSAQRKLSPRFGAMAALVTGSLLYGLTAVVVDSVVHRAAWQGAVLFGNFDGVTFTIFAIIVATLALLTGNSDGFVNLSSLHSFYAARLTRAYVGATNIDRLATPAPGTPFGRASEVNVNKSRDYIDVGLYQNSAVAAPIHLINVTLNETIGASSLVDRARKGALMTFAPEGVWIGARSTTVAPTASWRALREGHSEPLGLGQLCAISGAAASAGMGRMTTLGGALAFTYANVRLGYWWTRGEGLGGSWVKPSRSDRFKPIETFIYLFDEMTARYSRAYRRLYLSDGGHFENSGALELIRRGCRLILVADNGCDPHMAFGDLEILIRTARLDLGRNITAATAAEVAALVGADAAGLFFNGAPGDWREEAAKPGGAAFALLLNVGIAIGVEERRVGQIVWLKPRHFDGMSEDVTGYIKGHPSFPHETTGDQFFDEAQWESYRRLGVEMGNRLLAASAGLRSAVPAIRPRP